METGAGPLVHVGPTLWHFHGVAAGLAYMYETAPATFSLGVAY